MSKSKFLITERSLNYILAPVQVRQENYPYSYKVENLGVEFTVTVHQPWTWANRLLLDMIGNELFEREYKNVSDKRNTWKNSVSEGLLMSVDKLMEHEKAIVTDDLKPDLPKYMKYIETMKKRKDVEERMHSERDNDFKDVIEIYTERAIDLEKEIGEEKMKRFGDMLEILNNGRARYMLKVEERKMVEKYKAYFSKNRRHEYFMALLKRTSEVRFSFVYPIRVPGLKTYTHQGKEITKIISTQLKQIEIRNEPIFTLRETDGDCNIFFNTFLGKLFCHNLLTLNTDWFEESYLNLEGLAADIYRRFIVTRSFKSKVLELPIKEMFEFFGWANKSRYPAKLKDAFESMRKVGLIDSFEIVNGHGKFSKGFIKVSKTPK